ncbi:MAG: hypothetical protein EB168_04555 [Euryarchaeota archaeon]|jgi:hypothetical protein|nr:hypothetical protein [Euryarchaeota archaeon]
MTKYTAKGIVKNQYWVLTDGQKRIGEIKANGVGRGYTVTFNGSRQKLDSSMAKMKRELNFDWVEVPKRIRVRPDQVHGYPTDCDPFDGVWDLQHKVPIYTKEKNSKSFFCAGWYLIKKGRHWKEKFCPKLISIQRYDWRGPCKTPQELLRIKA